jgi:SpoVK/Ycf46/Vps4 family AAA+-type ATPase
MGESEKLMRTLFAMAAI